MIAQLNNLQGTYKLESDISSISSVLICVIGTSTAYPKICAIIRRHEQRIQAVTQNFAQPKINYEKYKNSLLSLFIF